MATPPETPTAPRTETAFLATATGTDDPPPTIRGLRRLMAWIVPANLGISLVWGAVPGILLPAQIAATLGEADKLAGLTIIATIGAFSAMLAQPIAGQLSDRSRSRFGRRAPWIVLGTLSGSLALIGLAVADSLVGMVVAWSLVQICYNVALAPLSAVLPDRVPIARRGTFSALTGIGLMLGILGGQVLGSLFFTSTAVGYVVFAVLAVVILTLFVVANPDHPSVAVPHEPLDVRAFLGTFWINPVRHPDFFWAFTGRLLITTAYFMVIGMQLYLLTDHLDVERPEQVIPLLALLSLAGILVSTAATGPLSDRFGRRKPFVFASGAVISLAFLLPWIWPDLLAWQVMVVVAGLGFGMFQAVDTALMSQVLPSAQSFAKDLGVVNIAATLPQTLAPGLAGALALTFGYAAIFPVAVVLGLLGALAVWPIRATR